MPSMLRLEISSDHPVAGDRELARACRDLYLDLKLQMEDGDVKPDRTAGVTDERTGFELFHQLVLSGASLGVFTGVYNLIKLWLDNRPTCEATITYPDGFQLKVSKISLEQARKLHEEHAQHSPETKL
jgi:hypothetical protein